MLTVKSLEANKLYILNSTLTGKPYLDEKRCCFLFRDEKDAKEAQKKCPNTSVGTPWYYELDMLATLCFAAGADGIHVKIGKEEMTLPLSERNVRIGAYNHELSGYFALLKQTRQQRFLHKFAICEFIVPVKIKKDPELQIVYGVAKSTVRELGMLYLVFSDLDEYHLWADQVPGWSPLKIHFRELEMIRGENGIMINPSGNRLVVGAKDLATIPHTETTPAKTDEGNAP